MVPPETAWQRLQSSVLTTAQVRNVDRLAVERYGMHSLVLMENAALGCSAWLQGNFETPQQTVLLCGRGNNGGDGLAIARHLQVMGWPVQVWVLGPLSRLSDDARCNLQVLLASCPERVRVVSTDDGLLESGSETQHVALRWGDDQVGKQLEHECQRATLIVDAMLGTGATGDPRPPLADWIQIANDSSAAKVAIDMPTGVDADRGQVAAHALRPNATLTFVARKPAMQLAALADHFGDIAVLPIGIPEALICWLLDQPSSQ